MDSTINMKTTAPVVGNDFDMLANDYQSEGNFVNRSRKDSKTLDDNIDRYKNLMQDKIIKKRKCVLL